MAKERWISEETPTVEPDAQGECTIEWPDANVRAQLSNEQRVQLIEALTNVPRAFAVLQALAIGGAAEL